MEALLITVLILIGIVYFIAFIALFRLIKDIPKEEPSYFGKCPCEHPCNEYCYGEFKKKQETLKNQ